MSSTAYVCIVVVRCIAVLFAAPMLILLGLGSATGFPSVQSEPEPWPQRVLSSMPGTAICCALLWPYRTIRQRWLFWSVLGVLTAASAWWLFMVPDAIAGYRGRTKSWEIIPTTVGIAGLLMANSVVLVAVTTKTTRADRQLPVDHRPT